MDVHDSFTSSYARLRPLIQELGGLPERWDDAPARVLSDVRAALRYWTEQYERPAQADDVPPARSGAPGIALFLAREDARLERLALHLFRGLLSPEEARKRADLTCVLFYESIATDVARAARRGSPGPDPDARPNVLDAAPGTSDAALPVVAASLLWASRASGLHGRFDAESQARIARRKYAVVKGALDTARELLSRHEANVLEELTCKVEEQLRHCDCSLACWLMALSDIELFEAQLWQRHEWAAPLREPGLTPSNPELDHILVPAQDGTSSAPGDARDLAVLENIEAQVLDEITDPASASADATPEHLYAERLLKTLRDVAAHDVVAWRHPGRSALVHILRDIDIALAECSDCGADDKPSVSFAQVVTETVEVHRRRLESWAGRRRAAAQGAREVGGKLRGICEFEYVKLLAEMADRLFDGAATVENKRHIRFLSEEAAEAAIPALERELGSEDIWNLGSKVRLPRPSAFGLRMKRARTCRCPRHQEMLQGTGS
ncbi:hypothetical protein [Streptomyces sp. NPDC057386]|uniref:Uncharacterized protein n=1 Tax=Streptomyces thermocoprophilus TaxID=78356 RepID=A0ABV5VDL2_9ACTN